jgi:ornithine carbamoyltransferase
MHCLPAFHDRLTEVGAELYHQAENRLHTIKAVLVATMGR